jgi:hypothetical protein
MEGPHQETQRVVEEVSQKMTGFIREVNQQDAPATGEFRQFCIRP